MCENKHAGSCAVTCAADLRLCFGIYAKNRFSHDATHMEYVSIKTTEHFFRFYLLNQEQHKITIKKEGKKAMERKKERKE